MFKLKLKRWRKKAGITQEAAVRRLSVSSGAKIPLSTYRKWEQGVQVPSGITRNVLERVLVVG